MNDGQDPPKFPSPPRTSTATLNLPLPPTSTSGVPSLIQEEPHSSNAPIPTLASAPPSANVDLSAFSLPPPPPPARTRNKQQLTEPPPIGLTTFVVSQSTSKQQVQSSNHLLLAQYQTHLPVLVIATENAHRIAWKNKLRLTDLLDGLAQNVTPTLPPVRSVTKSIPLEAAKLKFVTLQEMQDIPTVLQENAKLREGNLANELELLEDQVDQLLQLPDIATTYIERQEQLQQIHRDAFKLTSPLSLPWLTRYRIALDASVESYQPILRLLVCTTSEDLSIPETLQALGMPEYLPDPYRDGSFDAVNLATQVLVLHDTVDGPSDIDEAAIRQSLRAFGSISTLLRLNSIPQAQAALLAQEESSDLWGGQGQCGTCLSVSDRVVIRNYLAHLISAGVVPALERRIADLNVIVSDRKKGVKNVFKYMFGGPVKEEPSTGTYRHDSIESQTKLLAESLFLIKDYEAALSIYRLVKDDFKNDKANLLYGFVQEYMALCMYLTDPYGRAKEIFSNIENALLSYSRAADEERPTWGEKPGRPNSASRPTRLATRLCLVLISMQSICEDRHLEVADLLASASSHETALGAAVLLEQSSAHYFHAEMYRKYAFHMLMSGHMFRAAEQEHHAFRCFTSALFIYRDSKWEELHNHLRSALAAQLYSMGRMAASLQLYAKLVGTTDGGRVSAKSQQKFVNHLLEICNEHPKKALVGADRMAAPAKLSSEMRDAVRKARLDRIVQVNRYTKSASRVLELPNIDLPNIDDSTVAVIHDETAHHERTPSFGYAQMGSDEMWDELELMATAELKACDADTKTSVDDDVISSVLAKIEDPAIRRVIALVDKERVNKNLMERAKRSATYKESPPVRAQMEPLAVEFAISNPLAIPIDLTALQIVARMTDESGEKVCTNEDAIKITPLATFDESKRWSFFGSHVEFEVPDFCRVSAGGPDPKKQPWKAAEEAGPFFVVTKTSLTLEPESRRTIAASICPLQQGNLEILGVRCRLLDDIWVFHPFDVKGPLLQNTRSNRANRVRAESMILKAKVERGMPCLTAELLLEGQSLEQSDRPFLQGQVGSWILRLSNVGTAGAEKVFLKTNLPWISFQQPDSKLEGAAEGVECESAAFCLGPTGTLMEVPMNGESLKAPGMLEPGESVDIPVRIRPTTAGKQDFYMLFRYQLTDSVSPCYRWLRKMFDVPVYPSISLSASVTPSYSTLGEHMLSLQATNNRTERPDKLDLVLEKVSLASRCYRLEAMPGQFDDVTAKLGWQERLSVHYRLIENDSQSDCCMLSECVMIDDTEMPETKEAARSSVLDFMCLERAHNTFKSTLSAHKRALARAAAAHDQEEQHPRSIAQIRRANTSGVLSTSAQDGASSEHCPATSLARVCPPESAEEIVCVVCSWRDEEYNTFGEHYIRLAVRSTDHRDACPIDVTSKHPELVRIDPSKGPADVPVEVTLRNRLTRNSVEFKMDIETPGSFDFVGLESFNSSLGAGEELSISLRALIPSTGVFDLQRIRLTVKDKEETPFEFPMQWLVTVDKAE